MSADRHFDQNLPALEPDCLPIAVRAYVLPPPQPEGPPKKRQGKSTQPSEWTLVFDTETTIDAAQRLRVGAYQFRKGDELDEAGLFYDPAALSAEEQEVLQQFAAESRPQIADDTRIHR